MEPSCYVDWAAQSQQQSHLSSSRSQHKQRQSMMETPWPLRRGWWRRLAGVTAITITITTTTTGGTVTIIMGGITTVIIGGITIIGGTITTIIAVIVTGKPYAAELLGPS
jgi:hypothetical protein